MPTWRGPDACRSTLEGIVLSHPGMLLVPVSFDWCFGGLTEDSGVGWLRRESLGPSVLRNETMVGLRYLLLSTSPPAPIADPARAPLRLPSNRHHV